MSRLLVEIPTSQNIEMSYPLASTGERIFAAFIDLFVWAIGSICMVTIGLSMTRKLNISGEWAFMLIFLSVPLALILYLSITETLYKGQTLGKRTLNIQVMKIDGGTLKWSDMLLRAALIYPEVFFCMGTVGLIMISTTPRKQRIGDMAAGTIVVKSATKRGHISLKNVLSIGTTSNYTPKYPMVRQLSEQDMLFIKSVLDRTQETQINRDLVIQLTEHLREILQINQLPHDRVGFLRTLLNDYIVLTR